MSVIRSPQAIGESKAITNHVKRYRSDDDADDGSHQPMTLEDFLTVMNKQFKLTQERIEAVHNDINAKIDSVKADLDEKLSSVSRYIISFKQECADKFSLTEGKLQAMDERVNEITQEIGGLENRNELVVSGVPYLKDENLVSYFQTMWMQVGLNAANTPMVDIRRLNSTNSGDQQNRPILLQFALRNHRDDFYRSYLRKCDLQLSHLGINSPRRFYVNESLTVEARKTKAAALRLKKAGRLAMVFTKLGIVYVKGLNDQQAEAIYSEGQLDKFS